MPRFSIIVPSHGVEDTLPRTVESVLAQSFDDFELITVCDEPETPGAEITEAYAERDGRVAPAYSPPRAGLSAARTTGLREATGTYLLFLDGDDTLVPGALAALDARLRETGPVDVLHFEHQRVHWRGAPTRTPPLPDSPSGVFAPEAAPLLTSVDRPAWSAAYRRGFLTAHQLVFPYGHFTDLGWGGVVTVMTERVAVLRSVVVRHLLRRQGSRLDLPGEHQADLLDQVEVVLHQAAEHRLSDERCHALFDQLFAVVLRTAADPDRMPAPARRDFFRRAGALYRCHLPAGHRVPGGSVGVQHRLLTIGAYSAFRAMRHAHRWAVRAAGVRPAGPRSGGGPAWPRAGFRGVAR
ncbi:hypothetical protein DN051_23705 [Streptomyces cadmiisoli]|uniref:Glycosyltransferase 2-like domain-containing protein n=1 Tax=Streptomyces cadmiisoli TaxID=2184053 RepID=A0A2Z4J2P1_9ACTN|nr:hypothetical protein DN051_23705 [Streptomyces cadmiisoli]